MKICILFYSMKFKYDYILRYYKKKEKLWTSASIKSESSINCKQIIWTETENIEEQITTKCNKHEFSILKIKQNF